MRPGRINDAGVALQDLHTKVHVALHIVIGRDLRDDLVNTLHHVGKRDVRLPRAQPVVLGVTIWCASFALRISNFDGTQPYFRQSLPMRPASTSVTLAPAAFAM